MGDESRSSSFILADAMVDLAVIAVVFIAMAIIVKPVGDFPLNDDWSYGKAVKRLVEGEGYHPTGWTEVTLITQVLWGALFCLPQGFSFTALRLSTLSLSLIGVLALYLLIRQLQWPRMFAICCALTLGCNPLYFGLSNTFMTDVPFTTLAILSMLFFTRFLQTESDIDWFLGTTFAVATTFCRQLGICLPLGLGAILLLKHGFQRRALLRALIPPVLCIGMAMAFQHWLAVTGKLPALYNHRAERMLDVLTHPARIPVTSSYHGWNMLMYMGWFLLPVLLLAGWNQPIGERRSGFSVPACLALLLFLAASVIRLIVAPALMPVHNNVIISQGIGPAILRDTFNLKLPHLPSLPPGFWLVITGLSLVGASLLVFKITRFVFDLFPKGRFKLADLNEVVGLFFLLCACAYLIPFLLSGFFDRYLIPVVGFLLAFLAVSGGTYSNSLPLPRYVPTLLLIGSLAVFSVAGTRDYLEWNRVRWTAVNNLLAQKNVRPKDVDGGFEVNGWYLYDTFNKTNWWVIDDTYVIAFGEIPGYDTIRRYRYRNWMPPREGAIFVLQRRTRDRTGN